MPKSSKRNAAVLNDTDDILDIEQIEEMRDRYGLGEPAPKEITEDPGKLFFRAL